MSNSTTGICHRLSRIHRTPTAAYVLKHNYHPTSIRHEHSHQSQQPDFSHRFGSHADGSTVFLPHGISPQRALAFGTGTTPVDRSVLIDPATPDHADKPVTRPLQDRHL